MSKDKDMNTKNEHDSVEAVDPSALLYKAIRVKRRRDKLIKFKRDNYEETYYLLGERGGQVNTTFGDRIDSRIDRATNTYIEILEQILEIPKHERII